jgi:hypothetical protein
MSTGGGVAGRAVAARRPLVVCSALDRRLAGTWDKCPKRSTPMDQVADLVGLSGVDLALSVTPAVAARLTLTIS